tara:strand:+ start:47991 stop:49124 length:1134 start_codon:yes stop_codon:yes gene_type:complete
VNIILNKINIKGDRTIWGVVFFLGLFSILIVYSAAGITHIFKHFIRLSIGFGCMYLVHLLKFKYFSRIGVLGFWISIILLLCALIFGPSINAANRWLNIAGQSFQPSDIAKLSIILFAARQLSKQRHLLSEFKGIFIHILTPIVVICLLILPADFSTAALVFMNGLVLIFIAKIDLKYIFSILGIALFSVLMLYATAKYVPIVNELMPRSSTWVSRIDSFFIPSESYNLDQGYQSNQGKIAIHKGGLFGVGPGKSVQRNFVYASSSDFIFAIMIEEYGLLIGAFIPILLYMILFYRAVQITNKTDSRFGGLIASGLAFSLVFQAMINMAVAVGLMPVTGQTLPLVSMGGTSILFSCITIGIILSVSRDSTDRNYETI